MTRTMITLTTQAVQELKRLLAEKQASPGTGLRLGVTRGGCAGMQYTMEVTQQKEDDITMEKDGVAFFIAKDSTEYLEGCEVGYHFDLTDSGFKITNPNAARSCGCGTSFEAKGEEGSYDPANDCK